MKIQAESATKNHIYTNLKKPSGLPHKSLFGQLQINLPTLHLGPCKEQENPLWSMGHLVIAYSIT